MRVMQEPNRSRREFFRAAGRYTLLTCLAVVGAVAGTRKQTCVNQGICGGCGEFSQCNLPAAVSAKNTPRNPRS
jgi:hypothetical protein